MQYSGIVTKFRFQYLANLTFHDGGRYHIETSPLICYALTGFYMITASVMKELNVNNLNYVYLSCHMRVLIESSL